MRVPCDFGLTWSLLPLTERRYWIHQRAERYLCAVRVRKESGKLVPNKQDVRWDVEIFPPDIGAGQRCCHASLLSVLISHVPNPGRNGRVRGEGSPAKKEVFPPCSA